MTRTRENSSQRTGSLFGYLGTGLAVGAALGVAEVALRIYADGDPSIVRRGFELARYGAFWNAWLFGAIFVAAGLVVRVARARGWTTAREGRSPLVAATIIATILPAAVALVLGERLLRQTPIVRLGLLGIIVIVGVLSGWFVASRLCARSSGRIAVAVRWIARPRITVLCAGFVAIAASLSLSAGAPDTEPTGNASDVERPSDRATPDIVLIVIDTLRADVLGCYGGNASTPNIDALAKRGTLFEDVAAPSSWTRPSIASLFTSSFPWQHGCVDFGLPISADFETLAEVLSRAGYRSMAVIGNPFVDRESGFSRGFDVFDVYTQEIETRLFVPRLFDLALEFSGIWSDTRRVILPWIDPSRFPFLSTRLSFYVQDEDLNDRLRTHAWPADDRPSFLYVQYVAPHSPYLEHPLAILKSQPALQPENLDVLRARYEQEVEYTDRMIGEFLDRLATDRVLDETIVVVTSDHGEEFYEHGNWEHGYGLHAEVMNVPLIIAGPGVPANTRVEGFVGLLDLAPTLLDLVDVAAPASFNGSSFTSLITSDDEHTARPVYGETSSQTLTRGRRFFSVQTNEWKIIRERSVDGELLSQEIFHLSVDPLESTPVTEEHVELDPLHTWLDRYEKFGRDFTGAVRTQKMDEQMDALGYTGNDRE